MQAPAWHVSDCVHALPSLHVVPSAFAGFEHVPVAVSHVPALWHGSPAAHATGFAPVHAPAWQVSVCVHALPSLHVVPSAFEGFEHTPLFGSHVPAEWHWSDAAQATGLDPTHAPAWHVYAWLHLFAPEHVAPFAAATCLHVPSPLHESTVQGLPSSHVAAVQHSPPARWIALS